LLNAVFAMAILDLISQVYLPSVVNVSRIFLATKLGDFVPFCFSELDANYATKHNT